MLFLFRLFYYTLWLTGVWLLLPDFRLEGKYHILFTAVIGAFIIRRLRPLYSSRLDFKGRGFVGGVGVLAGLGLGTIFFKDAELNIMGIILTYLGVALFEMGLPDRMQDLKN